MKNKILKEWNGTDQNYTIDKAGFADAEDIEVFKDLCDKVETFLSKQSDKAKYRIAESYSNILQWYLTLYDKGEKYVIGGCAIQLSIEHEIIDTVVKLVGVLNLMDDKPVELFEDLYESDILDKTCEYEDYVKDEYDNLSDYEVIEEV